ncbi:AraC family transcriptional regulator [Oscillatoria laete-virens NRMC-F 0139]|nr:AraC family transcriptional regulator [Oscillatoria laete-virens]MDL5055364.1 AraC family transcriptional regulator [Oscillatoria laete-virens NRMC-F 0139]
MTLHRNHPQKPYECLVFAFKICRKARPAPKRFTQWLDQLGVGEFVREAVSSYHHEGIDRKSLSHYIYSRLLWQTQVAHTEPKISEFPVKLQKALHYLHENWSLSGNLHEVALKADLSLPHLHHLFQKFLGTSPHRYWLNLKLREARNQLVTTAFPIKQIVEDCGFSDLVNFGRHFKSRFGTTPGAYRRDHTDVRS